MTSYMASYITCNIYLLNACMLTSIEHLTIDISGAVVYAMYTVFYLIHKTTLRSGHQNHVSV